jgi:hypothetical protein
VSGQAAAGLGRRLYVGFDDTDTLDADRGTGKLARWFADELPRGCSVWGVVRQQLLVHPDVPYTSHNSAAVVVIEVDETCYGRTPRSDLIDDVVARAAAHLERHALDGSDPGLCVAYDGCPALPALAAFGRRAAVAVVTQAEALAAAAGAHLSGHGGTNDGLIGAAAGVGLTIAGWNGRLIEYVRPLRDFPDPVAVSELDEAGILVVSTDRDAPVPSPDELVATHGWLRPRLWGSRAVLPVARDGGSSWLALASERRANEGERDG